MVRGAGQRSDGVRKITRRRFLQLAGGGAAWLAARPGRAAAGDYRVGLAHASDAYDGTRRAVAASGQWPAQEIAGRRVVIKPNLVYPMPQEMGVTTDPEVVRALVDLALEADADEVRIVEGGMHGACFTECGYDFFNSYDPQGRVRLVDLGPVSTKLAPVPQGSAYHRLYVPELLIGNDVVFISAAKLKTHMHTHATLAMKNLLGLAPVQIYHEGEDVWRWVMHYRGISQVIVDLNMVRPVDFAVVDGVIGMEGQGPVTGTPVDMGLVVAGRNVVAVDRTCLWAMQLPQRGVKHLAYASRQGMGPSDMDEITLSGDPITPRRFRWPSNLPPLLERPVVSPEAFVPREGEEVSIVYRVPLPCRTKAEVVLASEQSPEVDVVRTLHDTQSRPAGVAWLTWDGRDDHGLVVSPGSYLVRVKATYSEDGIAAYATGWVQVLHRRP